MTQATRDHETQRRIKTARKYVMSQWGAGWPRLGLTLREALVRAEILAEIARMDGLAIDPAVYRDSVEAVAVAAMRWTEEE